MILLFYYNSVQNLWERNEGEIIATFGGVLKECERQKIDQVSFNYNNNA